MFKFNALVLITTNICNLRCRHCYPASGPSQAEAFTFGNNKMMSLQQAESYVKQIPGMANVNQRVHFGGGESTVFKKEFQELVSLAQRYNLTSSMTTNCSWAKDQEKADNFIGDMKKRGMNRIEISLSGFHQEFLDIGYATRAIRACKKHSLEITLRPVTTKTMSTAKALAGISKEDLEGTITYVSKCFPIGRARSEVSPEEFLYEEIKYGGCATMLNLTIRQDGSVYPCCAGSDITAALRLGNANHEPIRDILGRAESDPLLRVLFNHGTRYLAEILRDSGGKDFLQDQHVNICHLCNDLFINEDIARQVRQALYLRMQSESMPQLTSQPQ